MATTAAARPLGQYKQPYGLRPEPLRRMRGLDIKSAVGACGGPRASAAAVAALVAPLGAALLCASGLALAATLAGAALAAPPLVLFAPVLAPAALAAGLAAAGLLAAGALGVAGLSALAWAVGYVWWGGCAGGVAGTQVQPVDEDGRKRGYGAAAFVVHRLRDIDVAGT